LPFGTRVDATILRTLCSLNFANAYPSAVRFRKGRPGVAEPLSELGFSLSCWWSSPTCRGTAAEPLSRPSVHHSTGGL